MDTGNVFNQIWGGLVVSCQALENEPLYHAQGGIMPLMAKAALEGGAVGIRANSARDVAQIKEAIGLPVIGLIKKQYPSFEQYITVTMDEIDALVTAGADIIALDCTNRPRVDGKTPAEFIAAIKEKYPKQPLMADISTFDEGIAAAKAGADLIGTTLNGYTPYTAEDAFNAPNYALVKKLSAECGVPVAAEGGIHYPWQAKKMLEMGAWCVVVGGAITRPKEITGRFVSAMGGGKLK